MRPVYIAAHAHCTARGANEAAAQAVLAGDAACDERELSGSVFPYFRLPLQGRWLQRARAAVDLCTSRLDGTRVQDGPLFFASSSFHLGRQEETFPDNPAAPTDPDLGSFASEVSGWLAQDELPWCFSTACTSALTAMHAAFLLLRQGGLDQALVLATELDNQLSASGFHSLNLLSSTRPKPFAVDRDGLVLGEAVAALQLTTRPEQCGTSRWRVDACELALDTHSLTGVNPDGLALTELIERTLRHGAVPAEALDLIKVHAAGVGQTDEAEARALLRVFGARLPPLVSLKPYIGHTQGASALAELALLLDCLALAAVPGQPAATDPDPQLPLQLLAQRQPLAPQRLLLLSIGFGGSMGALLLSREVAG